MLLASEGLHCPLLLLFLLLLLLHPVGPAHLEEEEEEEVPVEVIINSTPCSSTCGLGLKTHTLCLLRDSKTAMEEAPGRTDGTEVPQRHERWMNPKSSRCPHARDVCDHKVSERCREHKVKCRESWECGLSTMTVTSGQRVEVDCLGEVMEAMGTFSLRWERRREFSSGRITR